MFQSLNVIEIRLQMCVSNPAVLNSSLLLPTHSVTLIDPVLSASDPTSSQYECVESAHVSLDLLTKRQWHCHLITSQQLMLLLAFLLWKICVLSWRWWHSKCAAGLLDLVYTWLCIVVPQRWRLQALTLTYDHSMQLRESKNIQSFTLLLILANSKLSWF